MYREIQAKVHKESPEGTYFLVLVRGESLTDELQKLTDNGLLTGELRIDDGREISSSQRKKAWATINDISLWNGDDREVNHWWLKIMYMATKNVGYFSLSDCSITTARHYITFLLDFCMEYGVPLSEPVLDRTDDINAMIYASLKHRKCIICGRDGEIHHWDQIGMGRNRNTVDDSQMRKLCLCRIHHDEAHQRGRITFEKLYHCYGIIYTE